ncbi:uncharacterized protein [Phyllobates terribilis]|uniref:uncharacterized protein n=1 Tax=Phyllobates terribilis TaxID=111132 RepID=UPI003CCB2644
MEFVRNMERRRLIKPQDILATLQSIPEDESESELQEHVFDSDSDEDFIPLNISSESEDSERTNPEDIPSTSTGDRAHAVMLPRDHPPGRGQKKSAKRPRNERTTDNDGGEGNATTNTREGESEGILVSADGIQWKPVEIGEHLPGRRDSQNILREAPGPTGYARRNIIIDSPLSAWRLFFDSYILTHIKNCTLAEACRNNNLQFTLSDEELDAFIAIFYARGISGTNRHSISSIWCNDWGIPFCKATMSRDRFVEIMRFLRFDEKSTRSERLQTDKFALFSTVWDRFIENCIACYKPGPYITVDEQLFPSKTRCPFTQYMPSKPDKYGHKYWLAVDKRSKYLANGFPYLGKDDTRRAEDRFADHVVMKLLDPFLKKGRNVTTDNYFTSVKLAKQLKSKGTTIVGTLNKIRREVPKEIKSMKEELYNTKVFRNEDNFTLTVYQGKPNKNVVILSSVHPDVVVPSDSAKKTPETTLRIRTLRDTARRSDSMFPTPDHEILRPSDYPPKEKKRRFRGTRAGRSTQKNRDKYKKPCQSTYTDDIGSQTVRTICKPPTKEPNRIFNLSKYPLDEVEQKVLTKGLNFCPSQETNHFDRFVDLNKFVRRVTLTRYFELKKKNAEKPTTKTTSDLIIPPDNSMELDKNIHLEIKTHSNLNPVHHRGSYIETFLALVNEDFRTLDSTKFSKNQLTIKNRDNINKKGAFQMRRPNITKRERIAITKLKNNGDIIIREADKGGGVVVQDRETYIKEAYNILSDTKYYERLEVDPSKDFTREYHDLINYAYTAACKEVYFWRTPTMRKVEEDLHIKFPLCGTYPSSAQEVCYLILSPC